MAAILTDGNSKYIFLNENDRIPMRISLKFIPNGPICNILTFVQIIAWRRPGDKLLSKLMLTPFMDAYMQH